MQPWIANNKDADNKDANNDDANDDDANDDVDANYATGDDKDDDGSDDESDDARAHQIPPPLLFRLKGSSLLLKSLSESNKESVCALALSMSWKERQTNTQTDRRTLQHHNYLSDTQSTQL